MAWSSRVYPRPRGEARPLPERNPTLDGLSPPTRGSRRGAPRRRGLDGSIPAHAGKPFTDWKGVPGYVVYPRPRGEAEQELTLVIFGRGLSPPTRGSPAATATTARAVGSIPAHAGKPS